MSVSRLVSGVVDAGAGAGRAGVGFLADGEGAGLPTFVLTPGVLLTVVAVLVVVVAVLVVVGWRVWRRVRAGGVARARLERGALALRAAALPPGPRRQVAQLRAGMRDGLAHTERVLAATPGGRGGALGELLGQLRVSAAELDQRLRLVQSEPAEAYLSEVLPALAARVAQVNDGALSLRRSAVELTDSSAQQQGREQDLRDRISGLAAGIRELPGPIGPAPAAGGDADERDRRA